MVKGNPGLIALGYFPLPLWGKSLSVTPGLIALGYFPLPLWGVVGLFGIFEFRRAAEARNVDRGTVRYVLRRGGVFSLSH